MPQPQILNFMHIKGLVFCTLSKVDCNYHAMTALFKYSGSLACSLELN